MFSAKKQRKTIERARLEISSRKAEMPSKYFDAKMGTVKDRNGMNLTEVEDINRGCKNTQKNYTKKIFMTQITTMV